jgi:radical SAM protein with 4Fe4S-binding SPASM domain
MDRRENLDLNRLIGVIDEVKAKFHTDTISLSGGEIFLYPYFSDLYDYIKRRGFKILIYTSGVLVDEKREISPIERSILKKLYISKNNPKIILNINGYNKNTIERINRLPGSFEIIEKSIEHISSEEMYLGANIVPFKYNYMHLRNIVDYCRDKNFDEINFLRFVPQGRGSNHGLFNSRAEFARIIDTISEILRDNEHQNKKIRIRLGHPINFLFLKGNEKLYDQEKTYYCRAGLDAPLILPNGDVIVCPAWKNLGEFCLGNIYKQDFERIWNSSNLLKLRNFIAKDYVNMKEPCRSCEYLENCRGKCIAQRLLAQKSRVKDSCLEKLLQFSPDPQCFKHIKDGT